MELDRDEHDSDHEHDHSHGGHDHSHGHAHDHGGELGIDQQEEQAHYQEILNAFAYYDTYARLKLRRVRESIEALSARHAALLGPQASKWRRWEGALSLNTIFLSKMLQSDPLFHDMYGDGRGAKITRASAHNMDKVFSTLRQFVREWAAEGADERRTSLDELSGALRRILPPPSSPSSAPVRVLCPGSGLGRLPFDLCRLGYAAQGNEWSFFMLVAGNYILNMTKSVNEHTIFPWIHQSSNVVATEDMFRPVRFPDVLPSALPPNADFSYTAGGFTEVYGGPDQAGAWDAIVTCFFIDTANNVVAYLDTLWHALKPGGLWLNLGPLLYHYSELSHEQSVELSLEEVKRCAQGIGFVFREEKTLSTTYCHNPRSMMSTRYEAAFWVAEKPRI